MGTLPDLKAKHTRIRIGGGQVARKLTNHHLCETTCSNQGDASERSGSKSLKLP